MAKYTDEQIFDYLRTLREGDGLTAVMDSDEYYTKGKRYAVEIDYDGDLYVMDNDSNSDYVQIGNNYAEDIADYFREGVFEIPTQATADKPFFVEISRPSISVVDGANVLEVYVDSAGLAKLFELESESVNSRHLDRLYARRAEIQAEIDALEAE